MEVGNKRKGAGATLTLLLFAILSAASQAGTATMQSAEGERIVWEYRDDAVRMTTGTQTDYVLVRDGQFFLVSYEDSEPLVIDGGSLIRSFASMMPDVTPDALSAEVVSFKATGRKERVAGLDGEVYEVRVRAEDGTETTEELVLSDAREARAFADAMLLMAETVSDLFPDTDEATNALTSRLATMNSGLLRYGDEIVISSISTQEIPADRFVLPAEPMDMSAMGGMLGELQGMELPTGELDDGNGGAVAEEGGVTNSILGIFGEKVDRQAGRISSSVENEVDRETDEAVDKQVNKLFKKLFGG